MTGTLDLRPRRAGAHHAYPDGDAGKGHPAVRCTCRKDGQISRRGWLAVAPSCPLHGDDSPYTLASVHGFKHTASSVGRLGLFDCRSPHTKVMREITRPAPELLTAVFELGGALMPDEHGLWTGRWRIWNGEQVIVGRQRFELDQAPAVRVPLDRCVCGKPALADWPTCGYMNYCHQARP